MSAKSSSVGTSDAVPNRPKYTGPDIVLVTFRWEFAVLPPTTVSETFTLDDHPKTWKNLSKTSETADSVRDCIHKIGLEFNGAAKLILVLFWSHVLKNQDGGRYYSFWREVKKEAWAELSEFHGKPDEFLGLVENVVCKNKGCLSGIGLSREGVKWFKVDRYGNLTWMSDAAGERLRENAIGELPALELKLI